MKKIYNIKQTAICGWLFTVANAVYCEGLLHLWITQSFVFGRFLGILLFAMGFGSLLGLLLSFIRPRAGEKWITTAVMGLVSAFYLVEYFVNDAYKTFMPVALLLGGAGGVARDFGGIVITLIINDLWRIAVMMLPVILFAVFAVPKPVGTKERVRMAAVTLAAYLAGFGIVHAVGLDGQRFRELYNFDSTTRTLGLNISLAMDLVNSSAKEQSLSFEIPETIPRPTEAAPAVLEEPALQLPEETVPQETYGYNQMDIDFEELIEQASIGSRNVLPVHQYVSSLTPTKQNAYTGLFAGKNLILITAEAFTKELIDPERTPTLYRLANEGIRFMDYYQPAWGGSTTAGEYSNLMGLVPVNLGSCMLETTQQKMFLTMGFQLSKLGYHSVAYHNHNHDFYSRNITHTKLGYEKFLAQYGGLEGITAKFPESDLEMIDITVPQYIDHQPFNIYYMTVSGHSVYERNSYTAGKNYDVVADMDASEPVKCYYAANMEFEYAMASLVRQLEEAGIADDTVIVIGTDHYPYGLEKSSAWENGRDYLPELYGVKEYDKFIRDHNALIIWSGCLEDMDLVVNEPVYSLDILPTISNLFGVEYDSRLLIGRDVFSDAEPLVLWPDHSWKTDRGTYDSVSRTFIPAEGFAEDPAYTEYISKLVANKITYSRSVQDLDYFNHLLDQVE